MRELEAQNAAAIPVVADLHGRLNAAEARADELDRKLSDAELGFQIVMVELRNQRNEAAELEAIVRAVAAEDDVCIAWGNRSCLAECTVVCPWRRAAAWIAAHPQEHAVTRAEAAKREAGTCETCAHRPVRGYTNNDVSDEDWDEWSVSCRDCIRHPDARDAWLAADPTPRAEAESPLPRGHIIRKTEDGA